MLNSLPIDRWKYRILSELGKSSFTELSTLEKAKFLCVFGKRAIESSCLKEQWFIAFRKKVSFNPSSFTDYDFTVITPPAERFFADPFAITVDDKDYIFFEDLAYSTNKGVISCIEIDKNGNYSEPKVVLERDYHLSYPFVFIQDSKIYMIPETIGNKTIELYEAEDFPYKWKFKKVLFKDIQAVDATILNYNQKYWLFANMPNADGSMLEDLHLFYSDSIFGNWEAHPQNPVISDMKSSRPAGRIFYHNGNIIRPSQETSVRYGYALNFNRIDILTETAYKETKISKIKPEFITANHAVHTYNSSRNFEVIDGLKLIKK